MNFNGSIKIYSLIYINKDYFITYKLTKLFSAKRRSIFKILHQMVVPAIFTRPA